MYEVLKLFKGNITCYTQGLVGSSSTFLTCACNKVISTPMTTFLIHQLSSDFNGSYSNNKAIVGWHDKLTDFMLDIYNKKTSKITLELLKEETYLTAAQALELGLVDEVVNYSK